MKEVAARWTAHKAQAAQQQQIQQQPMLHLQVHSPSAVPSFVTALTSLTTVTALAQGGEEVQGPQQVPSGRARAGHGSIALSPGRAAGAAHDAPAGGVDGMQQQVDDMLPRQLVLELGSDDDDDDSDAASRDDHAAISQAGTGSPTGQGAAGTGSPTGQGAAGKEEEKAVSRDQSLRSSLPAALQHRSAPQGSTLYTAKQAAPVPVPAAAAAGSSQHPIHLCSSGASSPGASGSSNSRSGYDGVDGDRDGDDNQGRTGTAGARPGAKTPGNHPFSGLDVLGPSTLEGVQPSGTVKAPPLRGLSGLRERLQQLSMGSNAVTTPLRPAAGGGMVT
jgi:hypothetical protein